MSYTTPPPADFIWDGGDLSCGELLLELTQVMKDHVAPGGIMCMITGDPGAFIDVPAWCGLTGHTLVYQQGHKYFIQYNPHTKGA